MMEQLWMRNFQLGMWAPMGKHHIIGAFIDGGTYGQLPVLDFF